MCNLSQKYLLLPLFWHPPPPTYPATLIVKLKCGVLPLLIETGRFKDIPRELRICKICDAETAESEPIFILKCDALSEVRKRHQRELPEKCKNTEKLDEECTMEMLHPVIVKKTSIMISDKRRRSSSHVGRSTSSVHT